MRKFLLTKEKKEKLINDLVEEVEHWDSWSLVQYVMDQEREYYESLEEELLVEHYSTRFLDDGSADYAEIITGWNLDTVDQTDFLFEQEEMQNKTVYPDYNKRFRAFELDPQEVKVVILGQDPYHDGSATGLAFESSTGSPSLRNIIDEMLEDLVGPQHPEDNDYWKAKNLATKSWGQYLQDQGVMLLNTALTVEKGKANSHKKIWEPFTASVIERLQKEDGIVWILWGNNAKSYKDMITNSTHKTIESVHPSPLSASRGFFGSTPFSKCNKLLTELNKEKIQWIKI